LLGVFGILELSLYESSLEKSDCGLGMKDLVRYLEYGLLPERE
jgi:hypothetical protein